MLTVSRLMGLRLEAPDGDVGRLRDVLFEDDRFRVRWLVVHPRRRGPVLVKPDALKARAGTAARPRFGLEAGALRGGPGAEEDLPVSRHGEACRFADVFRSRAAATRCAAPPRPDPRLQSCREVIGYAALLPDEALGRVRDLVVDERSWTVTSLVVGATGWGLGRGRPIAVADVRRIDWEDGTVRMGRGGTAAATRAAGGLAPAGLAPRPGGG